MGDKIKDGEMGEACSSHGNMNISYEILVGKSEGKRPLGRTKRRWNNNIKMDIKIKGYVVVNCIHLIQYSN
jgi:hypothetical protein